MPFTLETDTITTQNLTSRVEVGAYTAAADGLIIVDILLTGLAASAATITADVVINRGGTDRQGAFFADTKFSAGNTSWVRPGAFALPVLSGDVVKVGAKSSNASDTSISGSVIFRDGLQASALTGHTPQTGDCFARLGAPAGASVSADVAAIKGDTAAILVDTNELQTDWTNGGRLDLIIDAILADTNELQVDWVNGGRLDLLLDTAAAGGAGLTAQQVRDALKLAPSAGDPAAGSVDKHLDTIEAKTNLITTARTTVRVVSPVGLDGTTLNLVRADDYTADLVDRPVVIDVGDVEFVAADIATVTLTVRDSQSGTVLFSATGAAVDATDDDDNAVIRTTTPISRVYSALVRHGSNTGLFDLKLTMTDGTVYSAIADGEVNAAGA